MYSDKVRILIVDDSAQVRHTLAIVRELGSLDLGHLQGEQETFFPVSSLTLVHYPQAWFAPLAISAGVLLGIAFGLSLWRRLVTWRGLLVAFGTILAMAELAGIGVNSLKQHLPTFMVVDLLE